MEKVDLLNKKKFCIKQKKNIHTQRKKKELQPRRTKKNDKV